MTRLLQEADAWLAQSAAVGSAREEESAGDADALPAVAAAVVQQSPAKTRRRLLSMRTSSVEQFFMTDTPAAEEAAGVEVKIYPAGRHHLFHDVARGEVIADLCAWLKG